MSADKQPVPPIVADDVVAPYVDPLPKLRLAVDGVKESTDAVVAAIRRTIRNPKRGRSPNSTAAPEEAEVDYTTAVYAPLDSMANMPFSMKTAKLHSEALTAVAKQLKDILEAEEKERPKAIKRIDKWAAKSADGFDMSSTTHAAALAWFKDNLAFERVVNYDSRFSSHETYSESMLVATLASAVRIASYVEFHDDDGVSQRWCKAALSKEAPPRLPNNWNATTVELPENEDSFDEKDESEMNGIGEKVKALLPLVCPLRDLPATAVVRLFMTTTLLEDFADF